MGFKGEIWWFDGAWHRDASPTADLLTGVIAVDPAHFWVCGNNRTLLQGRFGDWRSYPTEGVARNFYSVEYFDGAAYVAGNRGVEKVEQAGVTSVDMKLGNAVSTHRLHSRDGLLWSIGEKDVVQFDGKTWRAFVHPDNAPE